MTVKPAEQIRWLPVASSNVERVGWDSTGMYVQFKNGLYRYANVPYQRAVACARSASVGKYVHKHIIPSFEAVRIT